MRLRAVRRGASEADFTAMYQEHYGRVQRFIRRRTDINDVEDLLVETFTIAWRRFDAIPDEPIGWLLKTASNVVKNHHRGTRRRHRRTQAMVSAQMTVQTGASTMPPDAPEPHRPYEWQFADPAIQHAFECLSESDRLILTLTAWDQCSPLELAAVLECKPNAAKTRLFRARTRFRDNVEQAWS